MLLHYEYLSLHFFNSNAGGASSPKNAHGFSIIGFVVALALLLAWFGNSGKLKLPNFLDLKETEQLSKPCELSETQHPSDILSFVSAENITIDAQRVWKDTENPIRVSNQIRILAHHPTWFRRVFLSEGREILDSLFQGDEKTWKLESSEILEIGNPEYVTIYDGSKELTGSLNDRRVIYFLPTKLDSIIVDSSTGENH
jgi:hypothetical protein